MAIYRTIQMSFWTDTKVTDDFTPEDKYFYLYLMTNPHTNLAGCYEISFTQMSIETGYTKDAVEKLIKRMEQVHNVIRYSVDTKEVLILNWSKYNWTSSPKFRKPLDDEISKVKTPDFKRFLEDNLNGITTVSVPYEYGSDTTVTDTDTNDVKPLSIVEPSKKRKANTTKEIYALLDVSLLDIEIKESIKIWISYKKEQFGFDYKPIGFKALLTEVSNQYQEIGVRKVIEAIQLSMAKGYKGIIWDLVKNKPYGNSQTGSTADIVDSWI